MIGILGGLIVGWQIRRPSSSPPNLETTLFTDLSNQNASFIQEDTHQEDTHQEDTEALRSPNWHITWRQR